MKPPFPFPPRHNATRERWADYWQASIEQGAPVICTPNGCYRMREESHNIPMLLAWAFAFTLAAALFIKAVWS